MHVDGPLTNVHSRFGTECLKKCPMRHDVLHVISLFGKRLHHKGTYTIPLILNVQNAKRAKWRCSGFELVVLIYIDPVEIMAAIIT